MRSSSVKLLTEEAFPLTHQVLHAGIVEGVAPGFVAGFCKPSQSDAVYLTALGQRRVIPTPQPMKVDTVFDLASITKVFATATLTATLVERKFLQWDTPLRALLPGFASPEVRLNHLLSHTSGLPAWHPFWEEMRAHFGAQSDHPLYKIPIAERQRKMRELVLAIPPEVSPGVRAVYSDLSFLLLGFALEEVLGLPLDVAVRTHLWDAMGLHGATFERVNRSVQEGYRDEVAATENCPWRGGVLQGQVHDDNCWSMGGYAGHAGAFASAETLLQFAGSLLSGFLTPLTLQKMWTPVSVPVGCSRTLGWDTPSGLEPAVGLGAPSQMVGHLGFTGTSLWIDPVEGSAFVLLSNRVHPSRDNVKIKAFRPRFHEALRRDLSAQR